MKTITKSISVLALAAGFTFSSLSGILPSTHEQTASAAEKINAPFSVYEVTANVLNIRAKPSTQGKILDTLRKKDQIEVVKFVNADWAAIKIIG
ncbi:SH3 domain-containing protein, partial [Priestia megaterium]